MVITQFITSRGPPCGKHRKSYHDFRQLETAGFRGPKLRVKLTGTCETSWETHIYDREGVFYMGVEPKIGVVKPPKSSICS